MDKELWAALFSQKISPSAVVSEFITLLGVAWTENAHLIKPWDHENVISRTLVAWIKRKIYDLDCDWGISSQSEIFHTKNHTHASIAGICDITIHIRSREIIYECKSICLINDDGYCSSNATEYL
ncbi:MAG: hypothetical protein AB7E46_14335, partial [Desulfovibrio sp.]